MENVAKIVQSLSRFPKIIFLIRNRMFLNLYNINQTELLLREDQTSAEIYILRRLSGISLI